MINPYNIISCQKWLVIIFLILQYTPGVSQTYPGKVGVGIDMGWNLPFADAARTTRSFTRPDGTAVPKDAKGWPMADAKTVLMDVRPVPEWFGVIDDPDKFRPNVSGTYKCSFNGQATLVKVEGPFTIGPATYNSATNTTTFDLTVDPPGPHHGLVVLEFLNTKRTTTSASNTGITNFKAIRPGYPANTTQLFTNEIISALKSGKFSTIRTMGFTETNNNNPAYPSESQWANRKTLDAATWDFDNIGQEVGAPWEVVIDLANAADVDLWINVPVAANDNYVTQLATLMKNRLEADRKLYVEYSNEVWNWSFAQAVWNNEKAKSAGLNHIKGYAKRTVEIAKLFQNVFGSTSLNNKIRVINAWQVDWRPADVNYEEQMTYINSAFGPPKNFIYGLGVAPYHNCGTACETGTVDQILDAMEKSSDESRTARQQVVGVATKWQIPGGMVAYEGGSDTGGGSEINVANRIRAERSPRMKEIMIRDLKDNWFPLGGGLFVYLQLASGYNRYGSWGLTDDIKNPDRNYKFAAIREIVGTGTTTPPSVPTGLTATAGNSSVTLSWSPASGATGYKVKRSTTSGGPYTLLASPSTTSYSDNGLANGTTYYYVVSATNSSGESANSTQVSAKPASSTVTVMREYWSNILGSSVSSIPTSTTPTSTSQLTTLEGPLNSGDNYGARIRAYIKPATTGSYTFYISGDDNTELWLSTDGNPANKTKIASVTGWTNSREWNKYTSQASTSRTLSANTTYYIEVLHKEAVGGDHVAVGWTGPGISSITVIGSPYLAPYNPSTILPAPTGLTATAGNASVSLTWTAVSGATSYTVKRNTGGNFTTIATGLTSTAYQDNNVTNGTSYLYGVSAVNASGESNLSNTVQATPSATTTLRNPENPTSTVAGLEYKYYEGTWSALPNFSSMTPVKSGNVAGFDMSVRNRADSYGFSYTGFVNIPTDGTYTFYTTSDDGSKLFIGSTEVVNNDGVHGEQERSGTIGLKAGKHAISVNYFEAGSGEILTVSYSGSGISKQAIPGSALFRNGSSSQPGTLTKATGTAFGTAAWTGCTTCTADKVYDGSTTTYFDANDQNGAYAGIDAGTARVIKRIRYYPRIGNTYRMPGGKFQGSNTSSSAGFVDLYTIPSAPSESWQQVDINNSTAYRYLRYLSPDGGYGNIAEVEFYYPANSSARISSESTREESSSVTISPNPAESYFKLEFEAEKEGMAKIQILNSIGKILLNFERPVVKGHNSMEIAVVNVSTGLHFVWLELGGRKTLKKVIVE